MNCKNPEQLKPGKKDFQERFEDKDKLSFSSYRSSGINTSMQIKIRHCCKWWGGVVRPCWRWLYNTYDRRLCSAYDGKGMLKPWFGLYKSFNLYKAIRIDYCHETIGNQYKMPLVEVRTVCLLIDITIPNPERKVLKSIVFNDILHAQECKEPLISVPCLTERVLKVKF